MKSFAIYGTPQQSYVAVPQGWSWPAFFFTILWAINYKMWGIGLAGLAIGGAIFLGALLSFAGAGVDPALGSEAAGMITGPSLGILFGLIGNRLRGAKLASRGAEFLGAVQAPSADGAIAAFMGEGTATDVSERSHTDGTASVFSILGVLCTIIVVVSDIAFDGGYAMAGLICPVWFAVALLRSAWPPRSLRIIMWRVTLPLLLLSTTVTASRAQRALARARAAIVIDACVAFRSDTGSLPDNLTSLVPHYLGQVPNAKLCLACNSFDYCKNEDSVVLSWWSHPPFEREVYNFNTGKSSTVD